MKTILIVDDEHSVRVSLQAVFEGDYQVLAASDGEEALRVAESGAPDVAVVDLMMPGMSGHELIPKLKELDPDMAVVVLSAMNDVQSVVQAVQVGAARYLTKPFEVSELKLVVKMALQEKEKSVGITALKSDVKRFYNIDQIVGQADTWAATLEMVRRVAESAQTTIMFYGESGTGKELLTRLTHDLSDRCKAPFIPIHCAAIPEALLESELFGHEKGSFTGATERRKGCVELADGGTLFLDEIGEMPVGMQTKLLRFLQDHRFMRVGGRDFKLADVRVLGATNKDLMQGVREGWFREDLYYRLNVVPITIPPLRERRGDVRLLVEHFLECFRQECRAKMKGISAKTMDLLERYPWPGNVRECRNLMERMVVLHGDSPSLLPVHLPPEVRGGVAPGPGPAGLAGAVTFPVSLDDEVKGLEKHLIGAALAEAAGNLSKAAVLLQTTRRIVKYKVDQFGLE